MGDGILKDATLLLGDPNVANDHGFSRYGARPTLIVMTDGGTNQAPSGWSMPAGFNWKDWTDYDGNGVATTPRPISTRSMRSIKRLKPSNAAARSTRWASVPVRIPPC